VSGNNDVTVVVTCFDYGRFLREAVASALSQTGGPPHVIVVDDGSTDLETAAVLTELQHKVEVIRQANAGVCAARNAGLARANTPYVLVLDADDRLTADAVTALRSELAADPKLGYAYGSARFFGDWHGVLRFPPFDPYRLLYRPIVGLSALMRKQVVDDTGGFDARFTHFEDWEFWLNALEYGWRGRQVNMISFEYRRHGSSKLGADRHGFRRTLGALKDKHRSLYRDARLAGESSLGPFGRLVYRFFWGVRPVPAVLEQALHNLLWRRKRPR
jgi:glycosyltransferase involved in cell wall biosynthesis